MQTVTLRELAPYSGKQFIEQCYLKLLLRKPDSEGQQHYLKELETGRSKISVIKSIAASTEARKVGVRVNGLWFDSTVEAVARMPVLGPLCSAVRILFTASSTLRDVRASRELALENQRRIQALEALVEKQRDLDPIFNSVASNHHHLREIQRRLGALEAAPPPVKVQQASPDAGVHGARLEVHEREIAGLARLIQDSLRDVDSIRNMAASVPAALRDQLTRLAAMQRQLGQSGSAEWEGSLEGRLDRMLTALGANDERLAKLTAEVEGSFKAAREVEVNDRFDELDQCLSRMREADSRIDSLDKLIDQHMQRAVSDSQRVDRTIEAAAAHGARLDLISDTLVAMRAAHAETTALIKDESAERYQLTSRLNHTCENLAAQGDNILALRRSLSDAQAESAEQTAALAAGTQKLGGELSRLDRDIEGIQSSLQHAYNRIEFIRREALFEMKYGAASAYAEAPELSISRVVNAQRVEAARATGLKLNVGCGHIALDDYINIDRRDLAGVDIVAEATNIPFGQNEVSVIRAAHLLEHFPQEQLRRVVLPHWRSLLNAGGKLNLVVPDLEHMVAEYNRGTYPYENFREVLFGGQEYTGDFHYNMFMPTQLSMLLSEAGFRTVRWLARGRVNGRCFEMELEAE